MKYRDTYRIVTQVSRYVSHRDFRYRATPTFAIIIRFWDYYNLQYHYFNVWEHYTTTRLMSLITD